MNRHHVTRLLATAAGIGAVAAGGSLVTASSALAATCSSGSLFSSGSSFQGTAHQNVWIPGWAAHSNCTGGPPTLTYTKSSSGAGLNEFGNNTGALDLTQDPSAGGKLDAFVGTDDPPNAAQLGNAETAAGSGNPTEITLPVAQAAVAVLLSLPTGCTLNGSQHVQLPNQYLEQVFEEGDASNVPLGDPGQIPAAGGYAAGTWGALFEALGYTAVGNVAPALQQFAETGGIGTNCDTRIIPSVRQQPSGTTYAFKSYLSQVNVNVYSGYASDYVTWPMASGTSTPATFNPADTYYEGEAYATPGAGGTGCKTTSTVNGVTYNWYISNSGGDLTQNTVDTPGAIGYAVLADAIGKTGTNNGDTGEPVISNVPQLTTQSNQPASCNAVSPSHQIVYAQVQNNGTSTSGINPVDPQGASQTSNCDTSNSLLNEEKADPHSYNDSWAGIVASDPDINAVSGQAGTYPLCGLTYDLVWHNYSAVTLGPDYNAYTGGSAAVGQSVKDYFTWVESAAGQSAITSNYYNQLPLPYQGVGQFDVATYIR